MTKSDIIKKIEQLETQINHANQKKSAGRGGKMASIFIKTAQKEIAKLNTSLQAIESKEN